MVAMSIDNPWREGAGSQKRSANHKQDSILSSGSVAWTNQIDTSAPPARDKGHLFRINLGRTLNCLFAECFLCFLVRLLGCLFVCLLAGLFVRSIVYVFVLFACLFDCLVICLFVCLLAFLSVCATPAVLLQRSLVVRRDRAVCMSV